MSQDWVSNLYTTTTVVDTTMSNMELMFATLKSTFSGTSQPSNAVAGQVWYDSNTSYKCLQIRDYNNAAWRGVMAGSSSCKIWLYLNAVEEGWTIDSSITDRVLALKGGITYTVGASASSGTWFISGISAAHESSHTHSMQAHTHTLGATGAAFPDAHDGDYIISDGTGLRIRGTGAGVNTQQTTTTTGGPSVASTGTTSHTHTISQAGLWRPAAAVGIMAAPNARG